MIKKATITLTVLALAVIAFLWHNRSPAGSGQADEFPIIYNVASFMNQTDLKEVENAIRSKGEQYLISIAVVSSNNAQVRAGDGRCLNPSSGRLYKVSRYERQWRIDSVDTW